MERSAFQPLPADYTPSQVLTPQVKRGLEKRLDYYWKYDFIRTREHKRDCDYCQGSAQRSDGLHILAGALHHSVIRDLSGGYKVGEYASLASAIELVQPGRLPERFKSKKFLDLLTYNVDFELSDHKFDLKSPAKTVGITPLDNLFYLKVLYPAVFADRYLGNQPVREKIGKNLSKSLAETETNSGRYLPDWSTYLFCLSQVCRVFPSLVGDKHLNDDIWSKMLREYFTVLRDDRLWMQKYEVEKLVVVATAKGIEFPDESKLKTIGAVLNQRYRPYSEHLQGWQDDFMKSVDRRRLDAEAYVHSFLGLQFLQPGRVYIDDREIKLADKGEEARRQ